ncbi:MAG: hypothetical protein AAGI34_09765 [Pseudomonadota bacterium]
MLAQARPAALALLLAGAGEAGAVEWSLGGSLSQSFEYDTNIDVEAGGDGTFIARSALGLGLTAETDVTTWSLNQSFSFDYAFGENGDDDDGNETLNGFRPNLSGGVRHVYNRLNIGAGFSFRQVSTSDIRVEGVELELPDPDNPEEPDPTDPDNPTVLGLVVDEDALQTTFDLRGFADYQLTSRATLSASTSFNLLRFDNTIESRTPSESAGASVDWSYRIASQTTTGVGVSLTRFSADNKATGERSTSFNAGVTGRLSGQFTPRIAYGSSLGLRYTDVDEQNVVAGAVVTDNQTSLGVTGALNATFLDPLWNVDVALTQNIAPSDDGQLRNVTSFDLRYDQSIDPRSRFALSAGYSLQNSLGDGDPGDDEDDRGIARFGARYSQSLTRDLDLSVTGTYSFENDIGGSAADDGLTQQFLFGTQLNYRLSQNWTTTLSYSFRAEDGDDGFAASNRIGVVLRRSFTLF